MSTPLPPTESATVGDPRQPTLDVFAYDGTTGDLTTDASCSVTAPDGTVTDLATTTADSGATWTTEAYTVDAPGRWVETWTVTGKGADVLSVVVLVHATPTSGGQTWLPTREQVAAYVPRRTHVGAVAGWGETVNTFTTETRPTAVQVDALIIQAGQWIELVAGPITNTAASEAATTAAAMRVAGLIELTWPDNRDDLTDAKILLGEADKMRKDVAAANVIIVGSDPVASNALPYWSFPTAPADPVW